MLYILLSFAGVHPAVWLPLNVNVRKLLVVQIKEGRGHHWVTSLTITGQQQLHIMRHVIKLSPYPALTRFTFHAPASSYLAFLDIDQCRGKQKADSREPGGKQDQDRGDLFFISTSLTRYPLQLLLCGL